MWQGLLLVALGGVSLGLIIALGLMLLPDAADTLRLEPLADRQVAELAPLRFTASLGDPPSDVADLTFSLVDAPEGAAIDPRSGQFSWTPTEKQGPGWYTMRVRVVASGGPGDSGEPPRQDECEFGVSVEEVNQPPVVEPIEPKTAELGSLLSFNVLAADPDEPARALEFRLLGDVPKGARIDPQTGEFQFSPVDATPGEVRHITVGVVEAVPGGLGTKQTFDVRIERPAALVMKAYPMLAEKTSMNVADRLRFLRQIIQLCPGNEEAWLAMAEMSREGVVSGAHNKAMMAMLRSLFTTFAKFPDFTWKVFGDLIALKTVPKQRAAMYEQLVALHVEAKRPDLACEAVLAHADDLVKDEHAKEAVATLSATIMAFPDEGRYVPKMLDKLEAVSKQLKDGDRQVLSLYQSLLPKVPQRRGNRPSPYCVDIYRRAIERFTQAGQPQLAETWKGELAKLDEK